MIAKYSIQESFPMPKVYMPGVPDTGCLWYGKHTLYLYTVVDMYLAEQLSLWLLDKHETSPICNLCPTVSKNGQTPWRYKGFAQTSTVWFVSVGTQ